MKTITIAVITITLLMAMAWAKPFEESNKEDDLVLINQFTQELIKEFKEVEKIAPTGYTSQYVEQEDVFGGSINPNGELDAEKKHNPVPYDKD